MSQLYKKKNILTNVCFLFIPISSKIRMNNYSLCYTLIIFKINRINIMVNNSTDPLLKLLYQTYPEIELILLSQKCGVLT